MKIVRNTPVGSRRSLAFVSYSDDTSGVEELEFDEFSKNHCERGREFRKFRRSQNISLTEAAELLECKPLDISSLEGGICWFEGVGDLEVLKTISECYENSSLETLHKTIEDLLSNKMFEEVNIILSLVNLDKIPNATAMILLSASLGHESCSSAREKLFVRAKKSLPLTDNGDL